MSFSPRNILVIDFGQLGDVVLSLPALRAIREKFPQARITVAVGKAAAPVVELSGYADAIIPVDRVALRDGPKPWAILGIFKLVKEVRRKEFDFVIDLHSLSETNLLGFFSGAAKRLYARRPGRSLDFLSRFDTRPPVEESKKHAVDRYLDVLVPLGIKDAPRAPRLRARAEDDRVIEKMLKKAKANTGAPLIGLFPGAGHPSRRWPLTGFRDLADMLTRNDEVRIIVFAGPEEREMVAQVKGSFPRNTIIFDRLTIPQLAAAMSRLSVLVSNDTGPMHIAAAVGTSVVLLLDRRAPHTFLPVEGQHRIIQSAIAHITTEEVYGAARELLVTGRTEALFAT
ncbi:MAG: glycosyltransferase family 9 protein [Pyrinomonadaceae bacterium]|nr:glycosyltransferase family 9 protein [Pyrinomonadaceae bacterium]